MTSRFRPYLLGSIVLVVVSTGPSALAVSPDPSVVAANQVVELTFTAGNPHTDPFNTIDLDVSFTAPSGKVVRVPGFWAGGMTWRARYASAEIGIHSFVTSCTARDDPGLHQIKGKLEVVSYKGDNPLYRHGPIRVAPDRRHFAHADGTPFFWLGDTWWMGLSERLRWPEEVRTLAEDRKSKGFTVIQIVAGLYPDMPAFDPRGRNESGFPWVEDYSRIRPEYFDLADRRLTYLADEGLVPCVVMAWGYHLPWLGVEKMKKHVRYVIARYGALPVVWCMAGEVNLPYYLDKGFPHGGGPQAKSWEEVIKYARSLNGLDRLMTVHPTGIEPLSGRLLYRDQSLFDFDMLQTGHGMREVLAPTIRAVRASYAAQPAMPVVNGEVCYEALLGTIPAEIARLMFWSGMLTGTAGHTYGANGIWQLNRRDQPYGKSPHGGTYGPIPWDEAMRLPGSRQLGLAKQLLEHYPWQRLEPHPEWATWAVEHGPDVEWGDWLWFPEGDPIRNAPAEARYFRKTFELPADRRVTGATLKMTADDKFTVSLNGRELGSHANWSTGRKFPGLGSLLKPGVNVLAVRGENGAGPQGANPAGLACGLAIRFADGTTTSVRSEGTWKCSRQASAGWQEPGFDDRGWSPSLVLAPFGGGPWGSKIGASSGDEFEVPYTAGIPGELRITYAPLSRPVTIHNLDAGRDYTASCFNPVSGELSDLGPVRGDANGSWTANPPPGIRADWVLVIKR